MNDNVDHPAHYASRNIGCECIALTRRQAFCTGNIIKYLWRAPFKGHETEDLKKALWYAQLASKTGEKVNKTGPCDIILHRLLLSTTGEEHTAWTGLRQSDWNMTIEALERMTGKEEQ
nr:MAG: protein of unknown function DUF3310 [Bacteriophage sp.]